MDSDYCDTFIIVTGSCLETNPLVVQKLRVRADGIMQLGVWVNKTSSGDIMLVVWLEAVTR